MTTEPRLPDWLRPRSTANTARPAAATRVAWLGRTSSDDQQDPTLSLPRQLSSSQNALPAGMLIVAHFYDVETSRKELGARGQSRAWTTFDIPIPRDGGIADLLAEAAQPDRRFDAVICESVDRIARFTHQGTKIEHDLELLGVPLLASDEPILATPTNGRRSKRASQILLRRTKQGVAEWYIVEMLEKSWDGFAIHTEQGWNVGKPPYGYLPERHRHPVPARRADGQHKTKLAIDPERGPTVTAIYEWRVIERLSYRAIADRLNTDLSRYLPPQPVDPERAVGKWTASAIREILINPKYTGHMCWNRRSTKDKLHPGKTNPVEQWVLSPKPTHPPLVTIDTFVAAQGVSKIRGGTRSDPSGAKPNPHRQTRRIHALRSYVICTQCDKRMFGRVPKKYTFYSCQPRYRAVPPGHPGSISVPEYKLIDVANRFFNIHLFGAERTALARASIGITAQRSEQEHQEQTESARRALADIEARQDRLFRILETTDDADGALYQRAVQRHAELGREHAAATAQLDELAQSQPDDAANDIDLLEDLPVTQLDLHAMPTPLLRQLFDAFDIRMNYDYRDQSLVFRATLTGPATATVNALIRPAKLTIEPQGQLSSMVGRGHAL